MTILVTGSAGHLGEALMRTLRARGRTARGIDVKPSPWTDRVGTIADRGFVADAMRGASAVIHVATLHKPHVATHARRDFVDVNVSGTLNLLEEAVAAGVGAFVFTSTTSAFGAALTPAAGEPAAWITEEVVPVPKNIYGITKIAAEDLCALVAKKEGLPVVVLRAARFFPEVDDDPAMRGRYPALNMQANELLHRRIDIEDAVAAHLLAVDAAPRIGFARYILSATTPFCRSDLAELRRDTPAVVARLFPDFPSIYEKQGWAMFPAIDRVYVNRRAVEELGWMPQYDFRYVLDCLRRGTDFRSALAREIGVKGYHDAVFEDGPYPVG